MTAICIVDRTGKIQREGMVSSDPVGIAAFVRLHAPHVARIGLETGATSTSPPAASASVSTRGVICQETPHWFAPATLALLAAIADDGFPVAIGLSLIVGGDLEREGFVMLERGTR
jgi:hypothetical protein